MKILIVSLFLILAVLCASSQVKINPLIVGGEFINIKEAPYQVALLNKKTFFCGGVLISLKHVLTAAHCINPDIMKSVVVKAGVNNISESGTQRSVLYYSTHVKYFWHLPTRDYDIAVIRLSSPLVESKSIKPIPLTTNPVVEGSQGYVSGWGRISRVATETSELLKRIKVPIWSRVNCRHVRQITDRMFCAATLGEDTCHGDSGGPFVVDGKLVGIVSTGTGCGEPNKPGVYTDVYVMREWIRGAITCT